MKSRFFFLLPLVLLTFACATITNGFIPSATIILKTVGPTAANSASLEQARQIIQERLQHAQIKSNVSLQGTGNISIEIYSLGDLDNAQKLSTEIGAIAFVDSTKIYPIGYQFGTKINAILTQGDIESAVAQKNAQGGYEIAVAFTPDGTQKMADYSSKNLLHFLLIVKDGTVISSPRISAPITTGKAVISGQFSENTANLFAAQLSAQNLPFALQVEQIKQ